MSSVASVSDNTDCCINLEPSTETPTTTATTSTTPSTTTNTSTPCPGSSNNDLNDFLHLDQLKYQCELKLPSDPHHTDENFLSGYSAEYYPFRTDNEAFVETLALQYPECTTCINTFINYLNDPEHYWDPAKRVGDRYIPHLEKGVIRNPNFGYPAKLHMTPDGLATYSPLRGLVQSALADPEIAKYAYPA